MNEKILILTPVYNDWKSLDKLVSKINKIFEIKIKSKFELMIVNDNSKDKFSYKKYNRKMIRKITIINLYKNVGSQRAIAIGLKYLAKYYKKKLITVIMDSDGQDNPNVIHKLLAIYKSSPNYSIVVNRGQRKEPLWFRILYEIYCQLVKILSAKKIRFGNFSLINFKHLKKLSSKHDLWSAYPPTLLKNLDKIIYLTSDREKRYDGESKMNIFGLIFHAIKVFAVLKKRIFLFSIFVFIFSLLLLLFDKSLYFYIINFFLLIFNFILSIISFNNKKEFLKNFKKINVHVLI